MSGGRLSRSGLLLLAVSLGAVVGCAEGARFAKMEARAGVVVYPLKKERDSIYASRFRAEALQMIESHCQGAYLITREGETAPQTSNTGRDSEEMVTTRRFWGLEFRCK